MPDPYDDTVESEPAVWTTPRRKGSNVRSGTAYRQLQAQLREHCRLHRNPDGTYGLGCWQCPRPMDYRLQYPHPYSFSLDHDLSIRSHPELALSWANFRPAHLRCNQQRGGQLDSDADLDIGEPSEVW